MEKIILIFAVLFLPACKFLDERAMIPNGRISATTKEGLLRYEKEWLDKKRHGIWRDYDANGKISAEYAYDRGRKTGTWKKFYADGALANQANYRDDKEEGSLESWHPNGKKSFSGFYKDGRKHGVFRSWDEHGHVTSVIEWENDVNMEGKFKPVGTH